MRLDRITCKTRNLLVTGGKSFTINSSFLSRVGTVQVNVYTILYIYVHGKKDLTGEGLSKFSMNIFSGTGMGWAKEVQHR